MHIVLVTSTLHAGGTERVLVTLANAWAKREHQVTVCTYAPYNTVSFYPLDTNIHVHHLACNQISDNIANALRHGLSRLRKLRRFFLHASPDIVITFGTETNVEVLLATRLLTCPVIVSERSNPKVYPSKKVWRLLRFLLYGFADKIVLQTKRVTEFFQHYSNTTVISNPLCLLPETDKVDAALNLPSTFIVAVGRLSIEKGFDHLLFAFSNIVLQHSDWHLVIVGEGKDRFFLTKQIADMHLEGRVHLLGLISNPQMIMRQAKMLVLSSRFEGFPNVISEAMGVGTPVVAYDCEYGPSDIIENGVNGILVPPGDKALLATAIRKLIENPVLRERMACNARSVLERFSIDSILSQWTELLYKSVKEQ